MSGLEKIKAPKKNSTYHLITVVHSSLKQSSTIKLCWHLLDFISKRLLGKDHIKTELNWRYQILKIREAQFIFLKLRKLKISSKNVCWINLVFKKLEAWSFFSNYFQKLKNPKHKAYQFLKVKSGFQGNMFFKFKQTRKANLSVFQAIQWNTNYLQFFILFCLDQLIGNNLPKENQAKPLSQ